MEEMKNNISVPVPTDVVEKERKPYMAPSAEIILLAPKEMLAAVDFGFHNDNEANRWALKGWGNYKLLGDNPASAVVGEIYPKAWELPDSSQ